MTRDSTAAAGNAAIAVGRAVDEMTASFERFCLAAGLEVLGEMLEADAAALCGPRHGRGGGTAGAALGVGRSGRSASTAAKVSVARPRVRERGGRELALPTWERATEEGWLGRWAMNLISTRS
jgi:hypothetical protein